MQMVLTPSSGSERIVLDKAILLFGRQPDCDVVLTGSRKISRKHCCVAQIHDYFVVRDLGSMNGVRVNGVRIDRESPLKAGDQLTIGDVEFRLEMAEVPKRPPNAKKSVWVGAEDGVRRAPAHMVSRDIPVAIPEDEFDFIVEEDETLPASKTKSKPKSKSQPNSKSSGKKSSHAKSSKPRKGQSDGVIVLGDDDILN